MNAGLKPEYRRQIISILAANPKVERVILFGSRASGEAKSASDIDLALYGKQLSLADLAALQAELEETNIPQRIDLILVQDIDNPAMIREIEEKGVEWYRRDKDIRESGGVVS